MADNHSPFTNWSDPNTPQVQMPFSQRSSSEMDVTSASAYQGQIAQRSSRLGPIRTGMSDTHLPTTRPSVSNLSNVMHTGSYSRSYPSTRSAGSSPSSESSSHSSYQRQDIQRRWHSLAMSNVQESQHQDILPPSASSTALLGFEGISLGQSLSPPYLSTPPTASSELPTTPFEMPNVGPSNNYGHHVHRPQSAMGTLNPGSTHVVMPLSAPSDRDMFSAYQLGLPMHQHPHTPSPPGIFSPTDEAEEMNAMHRLQVENDQLRNQLFQLQAQLQDQRRMGATGQFDSSATSSPEMEESWKRRTDARVRKFCSPNRAGNALCGWHDPRRERRMYPPRMAPEGVLNCGCTYEQALFEESLARHGVGSYLPGENVRMDPNLRNPLLKLLQERYGYRDGDFERDPLTGKWMEGEGPEKWEQEAHSHGNRHGRR